MASKTTSNSSLDSAKNSSVPKMMTRLFLAAGGVAFSLLTVTTDAWAPSFCCGRPTVLLRSSAISTQQDTAEEYHERFLPQTTAASSLSSWDEIVRTLELLGITWNDFLSPVGQGILSTDNQNPSDWDDFWELSLKPQQPTITNGVAMTKSNNSSNTILVAEQFTHFLERLGPTYAKFGQAMSSRPDIIPRSLAIALTRLQDDIEVLEKTDMGLDTAKGAREILRQELQSSVFEDLNELEVFLESLSETPVAAASIGVVYSGVLPPSLGGKKVAIKIQRPNVQEIVRKDARLLRRVAALVEAIPSFQTAEQAESMPSDPVNSRFVRTNVTGAVDEFMERLGEELDYRREARNLELFGKLYSHRRSPNDDEGLLEVDGCAFNTDKIRVVVPDVYKTLCTDRILVVSLP